MKKMILLSICIINVFAEVNNYCATSLHNIVPQSQRNNEYIKLPTQMILDEQIITKYTTSKNTFILQDGISVDNNQLNICKIDNDADDADIEAYIVYSSKNRILFSNPLAIKYLNSVQGLSFRDLSFKNNLLRLHYETTGGSKYYDEYDFIFEKKSDDFLLINVIKNHRVEVPNGYNLKSSSIFNKNQTYLSNFNTSKFILVSNTLKSYEKNQIKSLLIKSPLYKEATESSLSKMYLVAGDKVSILDTKTDEAGQEWYYISYQGKKEIKMWIKAEAVK